MLLKQIYSEPSGLFATTPTGDGIIRFKNGANFIFGKKESTGDAKDSLNGIGKSLFLDLLDFCLMGSFDSRNARLYEAKEYLSGYKIVLDFEVDGTLYTIKRSVDTPAEVELSHGATIQNLTETEAKECLCDIIFLRKDYSGYYSSGLLRSLLPFFLKIHRGKQRFTDPILYLPSSTDLKLNQFHFFFLNINNMLPHRNFELQEKLDSMRKAIKSVAQQVLRVYGLKKVRDIDSKIDSLNLEVEKLEKGINAFRLADNYREAELQADALTREIKDNVLRNHADHVKLARYKESFEVSSNMPDVAKIKALYNEMNELLGERIAKTIEEAIAFRKNIAESRKEFLASEITKLNIRVVDRDKVIASKELERAKVLEFLEAKKAITDLTDAFHRVQQKKNELGDLQGRIKLYADLETEQADLKAKESALWQEVLSFLESVRDQISDFRKVFFEVYRELYQASENESAFSISPEPKKEQMIKIDINIPAWRSEGKNPGRTLIYDIAVMMNMIRKNLRGPRFLAHDGMFSGMDKAHFVALVNYLKQNISGGINFQYLIPINEEGTLSEKFGKVDVITPEQIERDAILVLTPQKKLLGKSW